MDDNQLADASYERRAYLLLRDLTYAFGGPIVFAVLALIYLFH